MSNGNNPRRLFSDVRGKIADIRKNFNGEVDNFAAWVDECEQQYLVKEKAEPIKEKPDDRPVEAEVILSGGSEKEKNI